MITFRKVVLPTPLRPIRQVQRAGRDVEGRVPQDVALAVELVDARWRVAARQVPR